MSPTESPGPADLPGWSRAFELAAAVRAARVALVEQVRSGAIDLAAAHQAADADPTAGRVFAVKVYEALPGIGKVRARRTMASVGLDGDVCLAAVPAAIRAQLDVAFAADTAPDPPL